MFVLRFQPKGVGGRNDIDGWSGWQILGVIFGWVVEMILMDG